MKLLLLILGILLSHNCLSQDNRFHGNWSSCGFFGMSYYKIKKSNKVIWYSSSCVDRGTRHSGSWKSIGDTIIISSEKTHVKFILKEGKLCSYSQDGNHGKLEYGISQTRRFTLRGAIRHCRMERKRKRRKG